MKVIVLEHEKYNLRKKSHYFIKEILKDNFEFEYWDLSEVLGYNSSYVNISKDLDEKFILTFKSLDEVLNKIEKVDKFNTLLIIEILYHNSSIKIFKKIFDLGIKWVRVNYYHNPTNSLNPQINFLKKLKYGLSYKRIFNKILLSIIGNNKYTIPNAYFLTGSNKLDPNVETFSLDYFDVVEYKCYKEFHKTQNTCDYFVFLDIMFTNHPDISRYNIKTIDPKVYFNKMNSFFDKLEQNLGKKVVIAAHPKSNYTFEFGNRQVIKNNTMELVLGADLVITHGSLSISYALLEKKPILYIYFDEMLQNSFLNFYLKRMELANEEIGAQMLNIDSMGAEIEKIINYNVDIEKYNKFLDKVYLKSKTDLRSNYEIFKSEVINLLYS